MSETSENPVNNTSIIEEVGAPTKQPPATEDPEKRIRRVLAEAGIDYDSLKPESGENLENYLVNFAGQPWSIMTMGITDLAKLVPEQNLDVCLDSLEVGIYQAIDIIRNNPNDFSMIMHAPIHLTNRYWDIENSADKEITEWTDLEELEKYKKVKELWDASEKGKGLAAIMRALTKILAVARGEITRSSPRSAASYYEFLGMQDKATELKTLKNDVYVDQEDILRDHPERLQEWQNALAEFEATLAKFPQFSPKQLQQNFEAKYRELLQKINTIRSTET